jgi:hypothetical protein
MSRNHASIRLAIAQDGLRSIVEEVKHLLSPVALHCLEMAANNIEPARNELDLLLHAKTGEPKPTRDHLRVVERFPNSIEDDAIS